MGIPSYFYYVLKNHTKIIKHLANIKCSNLFLDANSIIYDVIN
jgi:5'-3' exonuclease